MPLSIEHNRYRYEGGPKLKVHKSMDDNTFGDNIEPGTSSSHQCKTTNDYSDVLTGSWP